MKTVLFISMAMALSACGSGPGSALNSARTFASASPAPTPPDNLPTDCSMNPALGTWISDADATDIVVLTADCKMTSVKCGLVVSVPSDFLSTTSSWMTDLWIFEVGDETGECAVDPQANVPGYRSIHYYLNIQNDPPVIRYRDSFYDTTWHKQ